MKNKNMFLMISTGLYIVAFLLFIGSLFTESKVLLMALGAASLCSGATLSIYASQDKQ